MDNLEFYRQSIVLGFQPIDVRPHTGYAVA